MSDPMTNPPASPDGIERDEAAERLSAAGGPAFPVSIPGCGDNGWHGMTLRDWFAAQVMGRMISLSMDTDGSWSPDNVSAHCYELADAMLTARKVPTS